MRTNVKNTPKCLVTKEWNNDSGSPLGQADSRRACATVVYDCTDAFLIKQPVVGNVSEHEYMRGYTDASKSSLAL